MVLVETSKAINHHRKLKRQRVATTGFKGVLHPDHLPATIGLIGFVVVFSLTLLKLSLAFMNLPVGVVQEQALEMFPLDQGTEDVNVVITPATGEFTVGEVNDVVVTLTPANASNRITGFDIRFNISAGLQVNHPEEIAKFDKLGSTGPVTGQNVLRMAFNLNPTQSPQQSVSFVLKVKKTSAGTGTIAINAAASEIVGAHVSTPGVIDYHGLAMTAGNYTFVAAANLCGGMACGSGQTCCNNQCKTLSSDEANCGSCGNSCSSGQTCTNGSCTGGQNTNLCGGVTCGSGQTCCNNQCKTLSSDEANCGSCSNACSSSQTCTSGSCVSTSSSGSSGSSSSSNSSCNDTEPDRPLHLSAQSGPNKGEITLTWTKADNADYYSIRFGTKWLSFDQTRNNVGDGNTTKYVVRNLNTGTAYYFQLWAVNGCKNSKYAKADDGKEGIAQWPGLGSSGIGGGSSSTTTQTTTTTNTTTVAPTATPIPIPETTEEYDWERVDVTGSKGTVEIDEDEYYTYESDGDDEPEDVVVTQDSDGSQDTDTSDERSDESGFDFNALLQYWPLGIGLLLAAIIAAIIISIKKKQSELAYYEERLSGDDELLEEKDQFKDTQTFGRNNPDAHPEKLSEHEVKKTPVKTDKTKSAQDEINDLVGNLS